jgi:hypothetical protein
MATSSTSSGLFTMSGIASESGPGNQGACFTVQGVTEARMTLKFEYSLMWLHKAGKDYETPTVLYEYLHDLMALDYEILIDVGKSRDVKLLSVTVPPGSAKIRDIVY